MSIIISKLWARVRRQGLARDAVTTTGWVSAGKGVGLLVPFFIAAWFGVTAETDAFFFAYGVILFFSMVFAPAIESVIVPYISEFRARGEDVGKFVGNILTVSGIGLILLTGTMLLVIKPILVLVTRFDAENLNLVYQLLVLASPLIILLVLTSVLAGTLNAYKKFAFPAISPAFRAICNIGFIFIFKDALGVHAIALGYLVGEIVRLVVLASVLQKLQLFKLRLYFRHSQKLKEFLKIASYQVIGMVALGLNPILDKTMASWLGRGSVSVLYYADRLYMIPYTFFSSGLIVAILSHWSSQYQDLDRNRLNDNVKKTLKIIFSMVLPITFLLILFHQPIVSLAFGREGVSQGELNELGRVWVFYLLGLVFYVSKQVFIKSHIVLKNTKVLMKCALYMAFVNIFSNYILMKPLQTAGIALSTTIVSIVSLIYLSDQFFREKHKWKQKSIIDYGNEGGK